MGTHRKKWRSRSAPAHNRCASLIGSPYARRLRVEQLEDRRMLAVITVQNDLDDTLANLAGDGQLSLREAIEIANNQGLDIDGFKSTDIADTIEFAAALSGTTISLADGELLVNEELTIDAKPLNENITIDAHQQSRIITISTNSVDYTLAGLTFTGGRTNAISGGRGGAIRFTGNGSLTLDQSIVSGNRTLGQASSGGGIYSDGALTLIQSTVTGNSTAGSGSPGGGINSYGSVTLIQTTVSGNSTTGINSSPGGGISVGSSSISLTQSTVSGNSTSGNSNGGGIASSTGPVTLMHSTVTDNHTNYSHAYNSGGGISNFSNTVIISHSIVAGNTSGGGGDDLDPGSGALNVKFSLIGNNDGTGLAAAPSGDVNGNFIGGGGFALIDPLLGPLANNGGLTKTHSLLAGSPAIDAGDSGFSSPPDFDQRGAPFVRVFDGGVDGQRIDIGAYELQTVAGLNLVVDNVVDGFDGDHSAGNLSLREAIVLASGNLGSDTIIFDAATFSTPQTISLTQGELQIGETVNIDATGVASVTIDAQQNSRVLNFTDRTGDLTLAGLTLTGGKTIADGQGGGAIRFNSIGLLSILQSVVSGNSTTGDVAVGGGIFSRGPTLLIQSTVSGNSTEGTNADGGGVRAGSVVLTQSTVSGNSTSGMSAIAGGIYSSGPVTLTHSTLSGNHANHSSSRGGGIRVVFYLYGGSPPINLSHSIVAGNSAGGGRNDISGASFNFDFSLIGDTTGMTAGQVADIDAGTGNLRDQDAMLAPLADNGGPTQTHASHLGSPVIDAGDPSFAGPPNFDQRGAPFVRVFDDPNAIGTAIDIGAYERQTLVSSSLVVDIVDDENDGNNGSGDLSLREAIMLANSGSIGANTITFDAGVFGTPQTISLTLGELQISETVTIDATAVAAVTIDAQQNSRVLNFTDPTGDLTLEGLTITGGQTTGSPDPGAGIRFLSDGLLTITNSTVSGNDSADDGGGIYTDSGDVTLNSSTVSANNAVGSGAGGGGVFALDGAVTLNNSTVSGNNAMGSGAAGGGIFAFYGEVTLNSSTVSGNSATGSNADGGGIAKLSGAVMLANSTVSGNVSSNRGGGIFAYSSDIILTNTTMTGNTAVGAGGGIYVYDSAKTPGLMMENSIVAGNMDDGSGTDLKLDSDGTFIIDFSLIGDTSSGLTASHLSAITNGNGNFKNEDPLLGPLADNGGPTQTHALLVGSPAIDSGDFGFIGPPNFDQRGTPFKRVVDGGVNGMRIDMGSYEAQTAPVAASADFDSDGDIDGRDFLAWQRGFGIMVPNATKSDGDADNDTDVDGVDLGIWQNQFGQPTPLAVAASLSANSSSNGPSALADLSATSEEPTLAASLIDAAMAQEWIDVGAESDDGTVVVGQDLQLHLAPLLSDESGELNTETSSFTPDSSTSASSDDPETTEDAWLSEELLKRVFG